mmetsp:Transcript_21737/g.60546  ORF Transcript_21737/g.60546 Transcript_21737/m.60546 type:complete len:423 (-) Transcript_21737:419-1687(-)
MAFEQPIEADQIGGDFNVLSAFVRAPLWILGGVLGGALSNASSKSLSSSAPSSSSSSSSSLASLDNANNLHACDNDGQSSSRDGAASAGEEEEHECYQTGADAGTTQHAHTPQGRNGSRFPPRPRALSTSDVAQRICGSPPRVLRRSRRKLSWSDQRGENLVEFQEQRDSGFKHAERPPPGISAKPVKSALKRTERTISEEQGSSVEKSMAQSAYASASSVASAASSSDEDNTPRYIPRMHTAKNSSLVLSQRSCTKSSVEDESPQWGFYTTLTPPTPEMYHGHSHATNPASAIGVGVGQVHHQFGSHNHQLQNPGPHALQWHQHQHQLPPASLLAVATDGNGSSSNDGDRDRTRDCATDGRQMESTEESQDIAATDASSGIGGMQSAQHAERWQHKPHQNKIFQRFQANKTAPMGWTSVPI